MHSVLNSVSGVAIVAEGANLRVTRATSPAESFDVRPSEVSYLLGEARDIYHLGSDDGANFHVFQEDIYRKQEALDLGLILLDSELPIEIRIEAIPVLEEALQFESVSNWLESILYAAPLPRAADISAAIEIARNENTHRVQAILVRLSRHQERIARAHAGLVKSIRIEVEDDETRDKVQRTAADE